MSNTETKAIRYTELVEIVNRFYRFLLSQYKVILLLTIAGSLIGLIYGKLQPSTYKAVTTFIVEDKSGSRGGGLSGLASQFGIDVGGLTGGGAGMFEGDNIFEIIKSRAIIEKVLLSTIEEEIPEKRQTVAAYYLNISGLNKTLASKNISIKELKFETLAAQNTHSPIQDSVLYLLYNDIVKNIAVERKNKKSSIITLEYTSSNPTLSIIFEKKLLKQTSDLYIDIKTGNLSRSIEKIQRKADSLQGIISSISSKSTKLNVPVVEKLLNENPASSYQKDNYINNFSYSNIAPLEQTNRDRTVAYTLFGEMVKNLETLKLSLINQTPIIQVVDNAKSPLFDQRTPARNFMFIGFLIGLGLSLFYCLYKYTK
jgi:uncharacterized protein involved in exopolysaccharide biosynthesis